QIVFRNDISRGSTVGPILSIRLDIQTVDIGCPQIAMHHSICKLKSTSSIHQATTVHLAFYRQIPHILASIS
ncbi:hypothetical protein LOAG_10667, partial [Loa loa]